MIAWCKRGLWSAFSVVWRHATRDGELRQTGSKCYGGLSGALFWRCSDDQELGKKNMRRNVHVTMYIYTSAAADVDFALVQYAHCFVAECRLEGLSFFHTSLHVFLFRRATVS